MIFIIDKHTFLCLPSIFMQKYFQLAIIYIINGFTGICRSSQFQFQKMEFWHNVTDSNRQLTTPTLKIIYCYWSDIVIRSKLLLCGDLLAPLESTMNNMASCISVETYICYYIQLDSFACGMIAEIWHSNVSQSKSWFGIKVCTQWFIVNKLHNE